MRWQSIVTPLRVFVLASLCELDATAHGLMLPLSGGLSGMILTFIVLPLTGGGALGIWYHQRTRESDGGEPTASGSGSS